MKKTKLLVDDIISILEIQTKTLESLKELEIMEMANLQTTKEYKKEIEKLNIYLIQINNIVNSINCHPQELEYDAQYVLYNINNYKEQTPEIDEIEIALCLEQIISQKIKQLTNQNEYKEEYENDDCTEIIMQDESYGETEIYLSIQNQIEILRIKKIEEFIQKEQDQVKKELLIQYKYRLIRSNKNIADQLIQAGMNTDYLLEIPDDIEATKNQINKQEYQQQKEQILIQYIEDSLECFELDDNVEDKTNISEIIQKDIDFSFLDFLLKEISTDKLIAFQTNLQNNQTEISQENKEIALLLTQNTLKQKEDYKPLPTEMVENQECVAVKEETLTQFISLIKLAELIIDIHNELCELEKQNKKETEEYQKSIKRLKNYLDFENEILGNLEIIGEELEKLDELLTNDLYLVLKNTKNSKLVKKRIENMIPDLAEEFVVSGHSHNILYMIHQTHPLTVLKEFQEMINKEKHQGLKEKLIEEKYKACIAHQSINYDMLNTSFNPQETTILDEQTTAELLNITELEYSMEKDAELYVMASQIIHEMINKKQKTESYIYYQTLCLEKILNSISLENIIDLEEQYNIQLETQNKIKKNPEKQLQLKPLFQKIKPSYL